MTFCRRILGNKNAADYASGSVISELSSSSGKPTTKTAQPFVKSFRVLGQSPHDSLRKMTSNTSRQNLENEVPEKEGMYDESLGTLENISFEEKVVMLQFSAITKCQNKYILGSHFE